MCKRVISIGFGPGLDSMSPARSWRSASHDAGSHDWLLKKTGGPGIRRGRIRWIQFAQSLLTVAHQPRAGCIRLVHTKLIISNVYIPQARSCSNGYQYSIEHLLMTPDTLFLGDFHAHHPSWYSRSIDTRGRKIANLINGSDYGILNRDSPTIVPPNAEPGSPDVSLTSASIITLCSWQTLLTLSSDHLPILIRLQMKTPSNPGLRRTYVNIKNANWDRYRQEIEAALSKRYLPTYCQRDEIFRTILLKSVSHHIPTGRHRLHEKPVPAEILDVMNRRDDLRKTDPTLPELPRLNKDIEDRICVHKRQTLRNFVETMDQKTDLTKLWRMIKGIDGRAKREAENETITVHGSSFSSSKQLVTNSSILQSWAERPE